MKAPDCWRGTRARPARPIYPPLTDDELFRLCAVMFALGVAVTLGVVFIIRGIVGMT